LTAIPEPPTLRLERYLDTRHDRYEGQEPPVFICAVCRVPANAGAYGGALFATDKPRTKAKEVCADCCDLSPEELRTKMQETATKLQTFSAWLLAHAEWSPIEVDPEIIRITEEN
jgi:hypothetical protein